MTFYLNVSWGVETHFPERAIWVIDRNQDEHTFISLFTGTFPPSPQAQEVWEDTRGLTYWSF